MKIKYSPDVDILMVRFSDKPYDYAEENDGIISHFDENGIPVLLEIMDAKEFVLGSLASIMQNKEVTVS